MLWYRSWMETRWRFLIGLLIVVCSSGSVVFTWPGVADLLPALASTGRGGEIGRRIREAAEIQRTYSGFIWSQAFAQNLTNMTTVFAVLLGTGGLLSPASKAVLFTLSLPATRNTISFARASAGLLELLAIALAGAITITLVSPSVGESYSIVIALGHAICLFCACAVFFALASLFSTMFSDFWPPLVIALVAAVALGSMELLTGGISGFGLFYLMSGEGWFRGGSFPWLGVLLSLTLTGILLWSAARTTAQRDF